MYRPKTHGCASSFKLNKSQFVLVYKTRPNVLFRTLIVRRTSVNLEITKKPVCPAGTSKLFSKFFSLWTKRHILFTSYIFWNFCKAQLSIIWLIQWRLLWALDNCALESSCLAVTQAVSSVCPNDQWLVANDSICQSNLYWIWYIKLLISPNNQ